MNITLTNVPYVHQYIYNSGNGNLLTRSRYYCGIASALMVRAKNKKGTSAPTLFYHSQNSNDSNINSDLQMIDTNLQQGRYGNYSKTVDVSATYGLLYKGSELTYEQYLFTEDILKGVFTGNLKNGNDYAANYGYVKSVTMGVLSATVGTSNSATKAIWDHINTYNEPVVVVVDSNKQISGGGIRTSSGRPTLHYIVIRGIRESSGGGTRFFSVYDPADSSLPIEYTESNLRTLMEIPSNTWPDWVYWYGISQVGVPSYMLKVQGN